MFAQTPWLPLRRERSGTAVLNDSPGDCQTRGVTEPQRELAGRTCAD